MSYLRGDYITAAALLDIYNLDPVFRPPVNFSPNIDNPYHDINVKTNRFVRAEKSFENEIIGQMNKKEDMEKVDIFAIKMLALLMCRDSIKVKSFLFLDAVIG